jgi:hypothetical protein
VAGSIRWVPSTTMRSMIPPNMGSPLWAQASEGAKDQDGGRGSAGAKATRNRERVTPLRIVRGVLTVFPMLSVSFLRRARSAGGPNHLSTAFGR